MTTIDQLLAHCRQKDIHFFLDGGELRSRAAPGAIDDNCGALIRLHKMEIIAMLRTAATADAALRYWTGHLQGLPTVHSLPLDGPRPVLSGTVTQQLTQSLGPALTQRLSVLAQAHGSTLFGVLHGALAYLLGRWSNCDDVVLATTSASLAGPAALPSMEPLVLRYNLADTPSFAQLLEQQQALCVEALRHRQVTPDQVADALQIAPSRSHHRLFQTMLTDAASGTAPPCCAMLDLWLQMRTGGAGVELDWHYVPSLFLSSSIERMMAALDLLLASVADDARRSLRETGLATAADLDLMARWNATGADFPHHACVHQLFERQCAAHADAPALMYEDQCISYGELNRRSNRLAHRLIALGAGPGQRVALCAQRSAEMVVGWLAVLKSGAACVPLDPAYPQQRLDFLLTDCAPAVVLVQAALAARVPAPHQVLLGTETAQQAAGPDYNPDVAGLHGDALAYLIYTSGSTGLPKGVMVEHASVLNLWSALARTALAGLEPGARVALNAALSFDASVQALVQLLSGHCLVVVPEAVRTDAAAFLALLERDAVDAFDCTPAQLEMLLQAGLLDGARRQVRAVLVGGEAIGAPLWQALSASVATRFFNVYGPTECTVDTTLALINGDAGAPHIGTPLANTRVYLLDQHLQPVPLGVTGELYIGGAGLARGYWNRAELTAERFIDDPFDAADSGRLYRSGDLGRWRADGRIDYLGRNDFQVKLRGFRIELGEIQSALESQPQVQQAAVRIVGAGDLKRLVAYIVAPAATVGTRQLVAALGAALRATLPEYMIPSALVLIDEMPLTPNGKIDDRRLPPSAQSDETRSFVAPATAGEIALAKVWGELFGLDEVSVTDDFFDLGGHSLLATQFVARVRRQLGRDIPLRVLFDHPQLRELSQWCDEHAAVAAAAA